MKLPDTEVTSSDAYLQFLSHYSLEDFTDDGLSHLFLFAEAKALYVLLEGHCKEEEAKYLVMMELSHV